MSEAIDGGFESGGEGFAPTGGEAPVRPDTSGFESPSSDGEVEAPDQGQLEFD